METVKSVDLVFSDIGQGASIATLFLDNPSTRNSLTLELGLAFNNQLQAISSMDPLPRALIISGKNGTFSSGGDLNLLKSFADNSPSQNREFMLSFYRLFLAVREMPIPVLAAVNGHAVGASLALSLACDLRYFTPDGKYAFNFVKIGIHPGMGSSFLLKEVGGINNAQELLLTGRYFSGEEALRRGLCHGLFSAEENYDQVFEIAKEIAHNAPSAVRLCKKGLYLNSTLEDALQYEAESQADNYTTEDYREAMKAIEEKRSPIFQDN